MEPPEVIDRVRAPSCAFVFFVSSWLRCLSCYREPPGRHTRPYGLSRRRFFSESRPLRNGIMPSWRCPSSCLRRFPPAHLRLHGGHDRRRAPLLLTLHFTTRRYTSPRRNHWETSISLASAVATASLPAGVWLSRTTRLKKSVLPRARSRNRDERARAALERPAQQAHWFGCAASGVNRATAGPAGAVCSPSMSQASSGRASAGRANTTGMRASRNAVTQPR